MTQRPSRFDCWLFADNPKQADVAIRFQKILVIKTTLNNQKGMLRDENRSFFFFFF